MPPMRRMFPIRPFLIVGALLAAIPVAARGQNAPLQVRDVLAIQRFPDNVQVDLSPDGKLVAFTLQNPLRTASRSATEYFSATGVPRGVRGTDVYVTEVLTTKMTNV